MSRKCLRISYRGRDLQAVANDAGIAQQALQLAAIVAGDALRAEAVEGGAVVLAFLQDRVPTQAGLGAFEDKKLEENAIVVLRQAPFFVVITDGQRVAGPGAADQIWRFGLHACGRTGLVPTRSTVLRPARGRGWRARVARGQIQEPRACPATTQNHKPKAKRRCLHDQARAPFVTWLCRATPLQSRQYSC